MHLIQSSLRSRTTFLLNYKNYYIMSYMSPTECDLKKSTLPWGFVQPADKNISVNTFKKSQCWKLHHPSRQKHQFTAAKWLLQTLAIITHQLLRGKGPGTVLEWLFVTPCLSFSQMSLICLNSEGWLWGHGPFTFSVGVILALLFYWYLAWRGG